MAIKKGLNPKIMQAWIINPPLAHPLCLQAHPLRWVGLLFNFHHFKQEPHGTQSIGFSFSLTFFFTFFPQLPTLFPPGKGPVASLVRVSVTRPLLLQLSSYWAADVNPLVLALSFSYYSFFFSLIDMRLFKDRVVAMGKPHCNYSIWTFGHELKNSLKILF